MLKILEHKVVEVQQDELGATVTCQNGVTFSADYVILAMPPPVIAHIASCFIVLMEGRLYQTFSSYRRSHIAGNNSTLA